MAKGGAGTIPPLSRCRGTAGRKRQNGRTDKVHVCRDGARTGKQSFRTGKAFRPSCPRQGHMCPSGLRTRANGPPQKWGGPLRRFISAYFSAMTCSYCRRTVATSARVAVLWGFSFPLSLPEKRPWPTAQLMACSAQGETELRSEKTDR